jgi:HD-GYP domain-containing protein (c-di-GMP phosphodiesterase class II)
MFNHTDLLSEINENVSLDKKLKVVHGVLKKSFPFVDRICVALYDAKSKVVRTFLASSGRDYPLEFYETTLEEVNSLQAIMKIRRPRVVNDLAIFSRGEQEHIRSILEQGYRSSYTVPMFFNGTISGFIFFNSYMPDVFVEEALNGLDVFAHLISQTIGQEVQTVRAMFAALKAVKEVLDKKDQEMSLHLERVSQYSRIIAKELAESGKYQFSDADTERISWFAPFQDVGKVGIADETNTAASKDHTMKGIELINSMIEHFGSDSFEGIDVLLNIAGYHHERIDGSGYPYGLKGDQIPIEARIVAAADVFDSMTIRRNDKQVWNNDEAIAILERLGKSDIDQDCVDALRKNVDKVERVQNTFVNGQTDGS